MNTEEDLILLDCPLKNFRTGPTHLISSIFPHVVLNLHGVMGEVAQDTLRED
jgi:hypothetical protein